jgi:hypothetical protein
MKHLGGHLEETPEQHRPCSRPHGLPDHSEASLTGCLLVLFVVVVVFGNADD